MTKLKLTNSDIHHDHAFARFVVLSHRIELIILCIWIDKPDAIVCKSRYYELTLIIVSSEMALFSLATTNLIVAFIHSTVDKMCNLDDHAFINPLIIDSD